MVHTLEVKDAGALALTSVRVMLVVFMTMMKSERLSHSDRQDCVEALGRAMYRGLAAGQEAQVAAALASQMADGVDVRIRRVAARCISYVLRIRHYPHTSSESRRPGGRAAALVSADNGARSAMYTCVGDVHVVAARMASESDDLVREYMGRWRDCV